MGIFYIYGIDVTVESVIQKGNFDQMRLEVENHSKLSEVYLSTKDYRSYSNLFKGKVYHISSPFFNLPDTTIGKSLAAVVFFVIGFISLVKRAKKIDVVVSQGTTSLHGALANFFFHKPVILYLQYFAHNEQSLLGRSFLSPLFRWMEFFSIHHCRIVIAPNTKLSEEALAIGAKCVQIIPNFVNISEIDKISDKDVLRKKLGIDKKAIIVLFVGRLHPTKNLPLLLKSLTSNQLRTCSLIVLGDGPDKKQLMNLVLDLGISNRVYFKGFQPKKLVLEYMKAADVFVLPSIVEGQPRVILEAWACGVPVVASKVNGIENLVNDGVDGLLFNLPSIEQLADSVSKALQNDTANLLRTNGKKHVMQYSEDRVLFLQRKLLKKSITTIIK